MWENELGMIVMIVAVCIIFVPLFVYLTVGYYKFKKEERA